MRWVIVWSLLIGGINVFSQHNSHCYQFISDTVFPELSFLNNSKQFEDPVFLASGAFHELKGVKIVIKRKNINSMMAARPKANFLFRKKENREYVIIVSNNQNMNTKVLYENMSTCAQVGVIGHELSHIVSYTQMSNLEMLWFGIKYAFKKKEIEAETDMMAIRKGFGEQIIEFNYYLHHSPRTNKKYLQKKKKYYLSSFEIEQKMLERL